MGCFWRNVSGRCGIPRPRPIQLLKNLNLMINILAPVFQWVARRLVWLVAIIAILVIGHLIQREFHHVWQFNEDEAVAERLRAEMDSVLTHAKSIESRTRDAAKALLQLPATTLAARRNDLDNQILAAKAKLSEVQSLSALLTPGEAIITSAKLRIELSALEQERRHINGLLPKVEKLSSYGPTGEEAVRAQPVAHRTHVELYALWQEKAAEYKSLPKTQKFWRAISNEYVDPEKVRRELDQLYAAVEGAAAAAAKIDAQVSHLQQLRTDLKATSRFDYDESVVDAVRKDLASELAAREERLTNNWLKWVVTPVKAVYPAALVVLASVILLPLALRPLLYYVGAPLAARRPPIRLVPESNGRVDPPAADNNSFRSSISQTLVVDREVELLVKPEYLQSVPDACSSRSRTVLRGSYFLTSIAAGLFNLTRVTSDTPQSVVLSAGRDSLTELAVLSLPEGSAMVFHPRSLVGVVQNTELPVKITSHWRILSLHAWMTFQFRYLVFHGPGILIARGARGVRIESVRGGRDLDQECTLGFSANLGHSTRRSQTFRAYLTGKKELLKDRFIGDSGYVVYEEMPSHGSRSGSGARGIEGALDSALKVLGI